MRIDGRHDDEVFVRPGGALWATTPAGQGEIGSHLALSACGGELAFLSSRKPVRLPSAYLHVGHLEVWRLATRARPMLRLGLVRTDTGARQTVSRTVDPRTVATFGSVPATDTPRVPIHASDA